MQSLFKITMLAHCIYSSYNASVIDLGTREWDMGELITPSKQVLAKLDMVILVAKATKCTIPNTNIM